MLQDLQLSHTDLDAQAPSELPQGSWPVMQTLSLHQNSLNGAAAGHLGAIIDSLPPIKTLQLS
jgi:hypothetical protein